MPVHFSLVLRSTAKTKESSQEQGVQTVQQYVRKKEPMEERKKNLTLGTVQLTG